MAEFNLTIKANVCGVLLANFERYFNITAITPLKITSTDFRSNRKPIFDFLKVPSSYLLSRYRRVMLKAYVHNDRNLLEYLYSLTYFPPKLSSPLSAQCLPAGKVW